MTKREVGARYFRKSERGRFALLTRWRGCADTRPFAWSMRLTGGWQRSVVQVELVGRTSITIALVRVTKTTQVMKRQLAVPVPFMFGSGEEDFPPRPPGSWQTDSTTRSSPSVSHPMGLSLSVPCPHPAIYCKMHVRSLCWHRCRCFQCPRRASPSCTLQPRSKSSILSQTPESSTS